MRSVFRVGNDVGRIKGREGVLTADSAPAVGIADSEPEQPLAEARSDRRLGSLPLSLLYQSEVVGCGRGEAR
jgi:hypothetical protein